MWNYFLKGGIMMYPLLLCSILSLTILTERLIYYFKIKQKNKIIIPKIENALDQHDWFAIKEICQNYSAPLAHVLLSGLERFAESKETVEETMESTALLEVAHLEKYLPILATIASVSTLLGFTGTVTGMIRAFQTIAETGISSPAIVGAGIAEALITTATGLIIAIPTIVFYHYFVHRVDGFVFEIEKYSHCLINLR